MPLADVFATPLGLAAAAAVLPLLVLYLIQPDPREIALPTVQFLQADPDEGGTNPVLDRFRRNLLLLLQILLVVLLAVALAGPYVTVSRASTAGATVLVVDASASMGTATGDGTRFSEAVQAARQRVGDPTTVVVAGATTRVVANGSAPSDARRALTSLSVTDAPGDLRGAVSRAADLAGPEGRVVVFSDFVDDGDWRGAVQTARAAGRDVALRQFGDGGEGNVGIVDRRFDSQRVTFAVANTGRTATERTISFGRQSRALSLQPGDVQTVTFPLPAESGTARLSRGDDFRTDDVAHVTVPTDRTVDTLLVTSGETRNLRTALDVISTVNATVRAPPVPNSEGYDVVVFADVNPDRVLRSTVEAARETARGGGGVVVQAQADVDSVGYGSLLPVTTGAVRNTSAVGAAADHPVTRGLEFPTPERHLSAQPDDADTLAALDDESPLLAADQRLGGRVLYYGYLPNQTAFRLSYRYPVFWKRAIHWLADRPAPAELNRQTGTTLQLTNRTQVQTPDGTVTARQVTLDSAGTYRTASQTVSASLLSPAESNLTAPTLSLPPGNQSANATTPGRVPRDMTPLALLGVVFLLVGELGFLRYRGDI